MPPRPAGQTPPTTPRHTPGPADDRGGPRPVSRRGLLGGLTALAALGAPALAGCTGPSSTPGEAGGVGGTDATEGGVTASGLPTGIGTATTRVALSEATDFATRLAVPWGVAVLADGTVLVSERETAEVKAFTLSGSRRIVGTVANVVQGGEGGLLGLAVDSRTFASDPLLYAYYTGEDDNRVVSMSLASGGLGEQTVLVDGIPKGSIHNGGRIAFGPDGYLYVTTGENGTRDYSQDRDSLGGKILRVTTTGDPAPGNPFGNRVWSLGHRNVQGLAWSADGTMWASEFGQDTWDELNIIRPGQDYGWPVVEGMASKSGYVDPVRQWATSDCSPSGIAIGPDGAVLMAALRGESLWKIPVGSDGSTGEPQRLLQGTYGRLRHVFVGPDGNVWIVTNNTSRGTPRAGDDRIVRLPRSVTG